MNTLLEYSAGDSKFRRRLTTYIALSSLCIVFGIIMGLYIGKRCVRINDDPQYKALRRSKRSPSCRLTTTHTPVGMRFLGRFMERNNEKFACVNTREECLQYGLPRNYIAYHLNNKSIKIDGKLDDQAWAEVPWSETFVDIRSDVYPKPYYDTKFKIRWDDTNMYVGTYIQENDLWATRKSHDSKLWSEHGLDILIAVDGTMFNYKQLEVNVLGTVMDLLMYKSYWDAPGKVAYDMTWQANAKIAVNSEGTINTPGDADEYWSVEIALPFENLAERSQRTQYNPNDDEVWFLQLGRFQQKLTIENGTYERNQNASTSWWAWQPADAINLHLQDRWGLVQFKRNMLDKSFVFENWHIYKALFELMEALKIYKAKNGVYTDAIEELDVPPYLLARSCIELPEIQLGNSDSEADFDISVRSMFLSHPPAHIRSDRFVTLL